jgi:hypothetical protein
MEEYKPFLMCDDSEKDGHAETMMDYVLSWSLRCTKYPFVKDNKHLLYHYCKYMLCKLIDGLQDMKIITIDNVRVWKQERYVDLWVEVDLHIDGREEHHAILIEDKYYTGVHDDQLARYKRIFEEHYQEKEKYPRRNLHYVLITCLYSDNIYYAPLAQAAQENGFEIYQLYDIVDNSLGYKETESDIFNELFLREWV